MGPLGPAIVPESASSIECGPVPTEWSDLNSFPSKR